jgi:uroporphyrinogen decarboxylase
MEYRTSDARPNHELGVWPQARARWEAEAPDGVASFGWRWFWNEQAIGLDPREYIQVDYGFIPPFERTVVETTPQYEIFYDEKGILHKALIEGSVGGARMSMDQYLGHPVETPADWATIKKRLVAAIPQRYQADLDMQVERWRQRDYPLILGENCAANGFYWRAREFMGTEPLSLAWYDQPAMMHDMMGFFADFVIETSRPVLERIKPDYFILNEDLSMKGGPLLSPKTYKAFIQPHLRRLVDFMKGMGVTYVGIDTDGDPRPVLPLMLDAGIDILWPLERASDVSPMELRATFGKSLRLWGGVDKRVIPLGPAAIKAHLRELIPLIEEGGFIPHVDHTVPPDISWDNFFHYMDAKRALLAGDWAKLD